MVLFKTWIAEISTNPSFVIRAVEEGLRHMGYERINPELCGVLTVASARFVLQAGTGELLCSLSSFLEHQSSFCFAALSMLPQQDTHTTSEHCDNLAGKSSTTGISWRYNSVGLPPSCMHPLP